ncbi:MAG TPA: sigma-54 dependent transcriptional regulator [Terriglobia bacterium]|jgi:DNA-binding NtrC family response regulator|nr:sigma-54 dependent transcriptional regulator [Terriglobia bacterium]
MANEKVLIVDDEKLIRWSVRRQLEDWGYTALEAESGTGGLAQIRTEVPDLILLDVRLPDLSGIEVLREIKQNNLSVPVIMITGDPQLDDIKTAIKLGALDFIKKPLDFDELEVTILNAIDRSKLRTERDSLREEVKKRSGYHEVIGRSPRMIELMGFVRKVAASEASTVLIQGESGTGKDLIAKSIHYDSIRADKPFVAINCSAIPETLMEAELFGHERGAFTDAKAQKKGLFEIADGGTLFLDEIGELSTYLQAKLLRVLEDQTIRRIGGIKDIGVDVRVIAASNRDLEQGVRDGTFRQDLFYRLSIIPIFIPPLRHRKEDILPLVEFFIDRYNFRFRKNIKGITQETRDLLLAYDWPGNVRELKNSIERSMILEDGEYIRPTYLPIQITGQPQSYQTETPVAVADDPVVGMPAVVAPTSAPWRPLPSGRMIPVLDLPRQGTSLEEVEKELVGLALKQTSGNQTHAARLLDISRDALRYKMKKFGFDSGPEI